MKLIIKDQQNEEPLTVSIDRIEHLSFMELFLAIAHEVKKRSLVQAINIAREEQCYALADDLEHYLNKQLLLQQLKLTASLGEEADYTMKLVNKDQQQAGNISVGTERIEQATIAELFLESTSVSEQYALIQVARREQYHDLAHDLESLFSHSHTDN